MVIVMIEAKYPDIKDELTRSDYEETISKLRATGSAGFELAQASRRYQAGVVTSLEVTDAQTRLRAAEENQITALYDYNLARVSLAESMGTARTLVLP